ncbi:MAG: hypothetical protein ACI9UJ_000979 [bacterium]|jgi:uncharacterized protein YjbI with pentapeptide repeats
MGYLKIPYIESSDEFWIGSFATLVVIILGFVVLKVWKNYNIIDRWIGVEEVKFAGLKNKHRSLWLLIIASVLVSGLAVAGAIMVHTKTLEKHFVNQDRRMQDLADLADGINKKQQGNTLSNVLNLIDEELNRNPKGPISESAIARLAALSVSLKPYRYYIGDTISDMELSPERGQLLIALALMPLDSLSFKRIKSDVTFSYADLRNADLQNKDLSGINLEYADLSYAELTGIDLTRAKLNRITMTGAVMNQSRLNYADLRSSNLKWVQLNESEMKFSNFYGANLSNAQLMRSDLSESTFILADLSYSILVTSILHKTDFAHCNLNMSDLSYCDLSGGRLIKASILRCNMTGLNLNMVEVSSHWLNNLKNDKVGGINSIIDGYSVLDSISNSSIKYYLSEL